MRGFWNATASAGPYANNLHLVPDTKPHHSVFTGRMLFLTPNQQCHSTEGKNTVMCGTQSWVFAASAT